MNTYAEQVRQQHRNIWLNGVCFGLLVGMLIGMILAAVV